MADADIDLTPTKAIADNIEKGLRLRADCGRGGTSAGASRARQLASRKPVSPDIVNRMASYFARHRVDKRAANFGDDSNPSPGYVAWLLWGGDAGKEWAERKKQELAKKKGGAGKG